MGLDNLVENRGPQTVDKDVGTKEWGLTEQIENSARGNIPDDPQFCSSAWGTTETTLEAEISNERVEDTD
jgi:hypothetical protein